MGLKDVLRAIAILFCVVLYLVVPRSKLPVSGGALASRGIKGKGPHLTFDP